MNAKRDGMKAFICSNFKNKTMKMRKPLKWWTNRGIFRMHDNAKRKKNAKTKKPWTKRKEIQKLNGIHKNQYYAAEAAVWRKYGTRCTLTKCLSSNKIQLENITYFRLESRMLRFTTMTFFVPIWCNKLKLCWSSLHRRNIPR